MLMELHHFTRVIDVAVGHLGNVNQAIIVNTYIYKGAKFALNSLDHQYITDNLSPGGCADLLAVSLMFYFLESAGMIADI